MTESLKRLLRPSLARVLRRRLERSDRRIGLALVYHRVADRVGSLDEELVPRHDVSVFAEQMSHLRAHYRVVPASELVVAATARRSGDPIPVAVTFDDDLASHVDTSAPILGDLGLTATFFVCGASTDAPYLFWWERLQEAAERGLGLHELPAAPGWADGTPAPASLRDAAEVIQRLPLDDRALLEEWLLEKAGPDPEAAGLRAEGMRALRDGGFELGFHTLRHPYLPVLDDASLERAMSEGRQELAAVAGAEMDTIAYPHGGADERVAAAARDAGFTHGFALLFEPVGPETDPHLIGRLETFASGGRFALELVRTLEKPTQR